MKTAEQLTLENIMLKKQIEILKSIISDCHTEMDATRERIKADIHIHTRLARENNEDYCALSDMIERIEDLEILKIEKEEVERAGA